MQVNMYSIHTVINKILHSAKSVCFGGEGVYIIYCSSFAIVCGNFGPLHLGGSDVMLRIMDTDVS